MTIKIPEPMQDFIKANGVMSLATIGEYPWICTLYYGLDEDLQFYVVSDPESIHGNMLVNNPNVAFTIFDSHTKITQPKKGIQGRGLYQQVTNLKELAKGILLWHKANPGIESKITFDDIKKLKDTKLFVIVPTYLKFFNKELYGKEEYGIWEP